MLLHAIINNLNTANISFVKSLPNDNSILSEIGKHEAIITINKNIIRIANKEMEEGKYDYIKFDDNNEYLKIKIIFGINPRMVLCLGDDVVFSEDHNVDETIIDLTTIDDENTRLVRFKRIFTKHGIIVKRKEYISVK